ncbi:hypothetical protein [Pedobacter nanyangensis]|uniref:hypothetical protein n=1 Tax=Pedobacter nanyangensis TaxID=1562389 RepID=UPI000DE1F73F|nr:hypothetical protein [Pedobacter nanyangensis]
MKKILFVLFIVFAANLGCKKMDTGGGLCACSPVQTPPLLLVVKGTNGVDMLNPATNGSFATANIKLYYQNGTTENPIQFDINQPFSVGNSATEKIEFYQLRSSRLLDLLSAENPPNIYLKLGNGTPRQLKATMVSGQKYKVEKLLVDNVEATAETGPVKKIVPNIFYFSL